MPRVEGRFCITHPFHPLRGREFELVDSRWSWGKEWMYCADDEGRLFAVPAQWTDRAQPDPFVMVAAGRALSRFEDLVHLAELVAAVGSRAEVSKK